MPSGKSKSLANLNGRRRIEACTGKILAPKSIRKMFGRRYQDQCTDEMLKYAKVTRQLYGF